MYCSSPSLRKATTALLQQLQILPPVLSVWALSTLPQSAQTLPTTNNWSMAWSLLPVSCSLGDTTGKSLWDSASSAGKNSPWPAGRFCSLSRDMPEHCAGLRDDVWCHSIPPQRLAGTPSQQEVNTWHKQLCLSASHRAYDAGCLLLWCFSWSSQLSLLLNGRYICGVFLSQLAAFCVTIRNLGSSVGSNSAQGFKS